MHSLNEDDTVLCTATERYPIRGDIVRTKNELNELFSGPIDRSEKQKRAKELKMDLQKAALSIK